MAKKKENDKLWGFLTIFLGPLGFFICFLSKKHTLPYVVFYAKQYFNLVVFVSVGGLVNVVPVLGQIAWIGIVVAALVLWVIGWINALQGKMKALPLIGEYAEELFKGF